jgi:uncharacterized phage-associated protein
MASVHDVAKFFLTLSEPEEGDFITNLKAQKLCYYAQGFALAVLGRPLFDEEILRWDHGPVVRSLYDEFRKHSGNGIHVPEDFDADAVFTSEEQDLLREVWDVYGQFSAWKLRNMTHEEPPWKNTRRNEVITHEAMKAYFATLTS